MNYDDYAVQAASTPLEGWDFSVLDGRMVEEEPSWSFRDVIAPHLSTATSLLDMGTGGGEFLASLNQLPANITATEGYPPNIPVARRRLEPLGVTVVAISEDESEPLPLPDNGFDVIINRHEYYDPSEIRRVLRPGGRFVTQQVGGGDVADLNTALGAPKYEYGDWHLDAARDQLAEAGFTITDARQEFCRGEFRDIGAVLIYLRLTPWQITDYTVADYDTRLRALHDRISAEGSLAVRHHRFLIEARG